MIIAHGIGGRSDLPIPLAALLIGAGAVLVITFVALAVLWTRPRFQDGPRYEGSAAPAPPRMLLAGIGFLSLVLVIGQVLIPISGADTDPSRATIAPVMVWVVFWLVVPFLGALIGNWYTDLNPWRAIATWFGIGRAERIGLTATLGLWPATFVLIAFVWLELIAPDSAPVTLGIAASIYTVFLIVEMAVVGRETGLAVFDGFTAYNRLISSISPLGRRGDGRLVWRGWLRSLPAVPEWPGLWVFVVAMVGTVSYDGASETDWFESLTGGIDRGVGGRTLLLVSVVAVIGLAYYAACAVAARAGDGWTAARVTQRFAHTLVPIALAYAASHYFTLILFEGQQLFATISDPFALGWDIFGTADWRISYFIITSTPIWVTQVSIIVVGHLVGVVLAHDRAVHDFGPGAVRSQYAMLGLMVALTSLGLLILSG